MANQHILLQLNDGIEDTNPKVVTEVKLLQQRLKDWGVLAANATVDGKFGNNTLTAVKLFQQKKGLEADGKVGKSTWAELLKLTPADIEIIPRTPAPTVNGDVQVNLDRIPSIWKKAATPLVPILVQAFHDQGVDNPLVLAYAAATIGNESSWNPKVVNTTDRASKTGFPGAGLAQITWKDNYEAAKKDTGIDFVGHPEYMFDPYKSLRAKASYYQRNGMIPYIEKGDYESAAGIYNAGNPRFRSDYTRKVARDTALWIPVFSS
ncbi:MAG: peptidoglycan-binding protein [Microcystaceae cyanobacterium]